MEKKRLVILGIVILLLGFFVLKKNNNLSLFSDNPTFKILTSETLEVTKEEMLFAIEGLEPPFDIIEKKERIANEAFGCIMMKKTEFEFEGIIVEVGAYFEVEKEEKMIYDTLFAWSKPVNDVRGYEQFSISELIPAYPTELATIRVRGAYGGVAKSMDLNYRIE